MLTDLPSWFNTLPAEARLFGAALLIFLAFALSGLVVLCRHGKEEYVNPGGLQGFLLESSIQCMAIVMVFVLVALSLAGVFAPVWFLSSELHWPYGISAILGIPIGLFLAAVIFIFSGIATR